MMLKVTVWFLTVFETEKKNHCVFPFEFMSFCRIRSYSFGPVFKQIQNRVALLVFMKKKKKK